MFDEYYHNSWVAIYGSEVKPCYFPGFVWSAIRAGFVVFPVPGPFSLRDVNIRVLAGILPVEIPLAATTADNQRLEIPDCITHDLGHGQSIIEAFQPWSLGFYPFLAASIQLLRLSSGYSRAQRAVSASPTIRSDIFDQVMLGMLHESHLAKAEGREGQLGKHGLGPTPRQRESREREYGKEIGSDTQPGMGPMEDVLGAEMIRHNRPGDIEFPPGTKASEIIEMCRLVHQVMFKGRT